MQTTMILFYAKSETHCKLEYMRRKELKECNHNYIWSEKPFLKNTTFADLISTHINCTVRVNEKLLERVCKKDCHTILLQFKVNMM